jgi:hypothetical protein
MKISKRNLNMLIENFLFEQEDITARSFDFNKSERIKSEDSLIGMLYFLNNEYRTNGPNYLVTDNQNLYSIAGGVSNKESVNNLPDYLKQVIFLIGIGVMALNKIDKEDVKRVVVISSIERTSEAQVRAMSNKVKIAMDQGVDPIEAVASLYSPENDPTMTQDGYENAKKVVSLLQQNKYDEALIAMENVPVSPHQSNHAIDFRAEGGRGEKILAAIEHLKSIGVFNENIKYIEEDPGGNNHHIHVAAISDPFAQKGKELISRMNDPQEREARKVVDYMEKVGLFR